MSHLRKELFRLQRLVCKEALLITHNRLANRRWLAGALRLIYTVLLPGSLVWLGGFIFQKFLDSIEVQQQYF